MNRERTIIESAPADPSRFYRERQAALAKEKTEEEEAGKNKKKGKRNKDKPAGLDFKYEHDDDDDDYNAAKGDEESSDSEHDSEMSEDAKRIKANLMEELERKDNENADQKQSILLKRFVADQDDPDDDDDAPMEESKLEGSAIDDNNYDLDDPDDRELFEDVPSQDEVADIGKRSVASALVAGDPKKRVRKD